MKLLFLLLMLSWSAAIFADTEEPTLEMLLFLADFVDEQGNWDGPDMEQPRYNQGIVNGVDYE